MYRGLAISVRLVVRLCACPTDDLAQVYRSELLKEQLREIEVLPLDPREQRLHAAKTMQEQVNQKIATFVCLLVQEPDMFWKTLP